MQAGLIFAVCAASVASVTAETTVLAGCFTLVTLESCCDSVDGRPGEYNGQKCVPTKALEEGDPQAPSNEFGESHVCQPACWVTNTCAYTKPHGSFGDQTIVEGECATTTTTTTTTVTPWDSSASSSADSNSLESSWSSSFKEASSESFDSSGDSSLGSSGSDASGSSGSYMFLWQWLLLALCCCAAAIAPLLKPKPKKKAPKKPSGPAKTTLASDHPAGCTYLEVTSQTGFKAGQTIEIGAGTPTAEIHEVTGLGSILLAAPLLYPHPLGTPVQVLPDPKVPAQVPFVAPVATTSTVIPSYSIAPPTYAAPAMTAYAAPATTAYAAAPVSYAAPATTAYAAPATMSYAAPATMTYAPGTGI